MFDCLYGEKDTIIRAFRDRHGLHATEWDSVMERGYMKAMEICDIEDPHFPGFAYWLMRHELYSKRKETSMGNKINYPSFAWSPKRQKTLRALFQAGKSVKELAEHFETDEATVYKAIDKYDLVRDSTKADPAPAAPAVKPEPANTSQTGQPAPLNKTDIVTYDVHAQRSLSQLNVLFHLIVDAANHNNDVMGSLSENKNNEAYFELGQQCVKLQEAEKIIKNMMSVPPGQ